MYSPKISEDLIPVLCRIRVKEGIPMTTLLDRFLRECISEYLTDFDENDRHVPVFVARDYIDTE